MYNNGFISIENDPTDEFQQSVEVECGALLSNSGTLNITNSSATSAIQVECSGTFINEDCGQLNIFSNSFIDVEASEGTFTNNGVINTAFTGTNSNSGTFTNNGQINAPVSFTTAPNAVVEGPDLPYPWYGSNIGNAGSGNDFSFVRCEEDFVISSGANNLSPQNSDNVAFATVPLCGNGGIQARIKDVVGGYAGLMIRESSAPGAKMFSVYSNLTNLLRSEIRTVDNGNRNSNSFYASFPKWLRLVRQGNYIKAFYRNSNGGGWIQFHQAYIEMGYCVEMGLAVFTNIPNGNATGVFGNVRYQSQDTPELSAPANGTIVAESAAVQRASIMPNPVSSNFTLRFSNPLTTDGTATLINEFGQRLSQQPLGAGATNLDWDASQLPSGLYLMEVITEDGYREVLKVVRQ